LIAPTSLRQARWLATCWAGSRSSRPCWRTSPPGTIPEG